MSSFLGLNVIQFLFNGVLGMSLGLVSHSVLHLGALFELLKLFLKQIWISVHDRLERVVKRWGIGVRGELQIVLVIELETLIELSIQIV